MRNLQEERLQLQQLLEQKKEELEECHDELQELNDRTAILHEEEQNGREQVSKVRYNNLVSKFFYVFIKVLSLKE